MAAPQDSQESKLKLTHKLVLLLGAVMVIAITGTSVALMKNFSDTTGEMLATISEFNAEILKRQEAAPTQMDPESRADIRRLMETSTASLDSQRQSSHSRGLWLSLLAGAISVVVLVGLFLQVLKRSFFGPINEMGESLSESVITVASASGQLAEMIHFLSQGASQQAASIEETSSSLEEMSAMTKMNADNAAQGDAHTKENRQLVRSASEAMERLTVSMREISKASEETSKIVKTIDEIAFQTNLLALNAAIEAARAGDAGEGFAVVANEVRSLAMRAAEAARNTSAMIEGTVSKVKEGSALVKTVGDVFGKVAQSTDRVEELVAAISEGSREQALGVEQINRSLAEIEKIVQGVASNAQESEGACEEMSAQSEQMKAIVNNMVNLVSSGKKKTIIYFGVVPLESPSIMTKKFTPLAEYLSRETGVPFRLMVGRNYQATVDDLGENNVQLAYMTPTTYPKSERQYPEAEVRPIAKFKEKGEAVYRSCIVVRAGSPITRLSEIKGKRFAFGNEQSTASHLMPRSMLVNAGIDMDRDLTEIRYVGSHTNVASSVESGLVDAGGLLESVGEQEQKKGRVKVLAKSDYIPQFPICVNRYLPENLLEKIEEALAKLDSPASEYREILTAIDPKLTGITVAAAADYDIARKMILNLYGEAFYDK